MTEATVTEQLITATESDLDNTIALMELLRATAEKNGFPIETYVYAVLSEVALIAAKVEAKQDEPLVFTNNIAGVVYEVQAYAKT